MAACESGFAIDYCIDGNYECSSTTISSSSVSKCVYVIEIDSLNDCKIKYNDGAKDMTIRLGRSSRYCMRIQAKLEMFEKYVR
jgi:hypothetical protein